MVVKRELTDGQTDLTRSRRDLGCESPLLKGLWLTQRRHLDVFFSFRVRAKGDFGGLWRDRMGVDGVLVGYLFYFNSTFFVTVKM